MADKDQIIKDLKAVDNQTDSIITPDQYQFLGSHSFEEVIATFGTWQEALNESEISLKSKIAEDVLRINKKVDGSVTQPEYRKNGDYPFTKIQEEFGTWNNLKQDLGLDVHERSIPDKKLEKDMKRVAGNIDHPLTASKYNELGKYSSGIFALREYTFSEFREKIGLRGLDKRGYPSKEALKAWKNELNSVKSRFSAKELKEKLNSTGYNYSTAYRRSLQDYLEREGFQFSVSSGSGSKYYIKDPEAPSLEEYYKQFLEKIPDEKENWFMEMSGTGPSPKSITAAIRYLTEEKSQIQIAKEEDITPVSLRSTKSKIIKEFGLDDAAGNEKIY